MQRLGQVKVPCRDKSRDRRRLLWSSYNVVGGKSEVVNVEVARPVCA